MTAAGSVAVAAQDGSGSKQEALLTHHSLGPAVLAASPLPLVTLLEGEADQRPPGENP